MENYKNEETIILSVSEEHEVSIKNIAELIALNFDYKDKIVYNKNYSDGQYKKTADNKKLLEIYNDFKFTSIDQGIMKTIKWFKENYEMCRK